MSLFSFLLLAFLCFNSAFCQANVSKSCASFSTNGTAASAYQYYRFYDFRGSNAGGISGATKANVKVVSDSTWKNDWYIRDFPRNAPNPTAIPAAFTPDKVYMSNDSGVSFLTLNTERKDAQTQPSAEISYREFGADQILYASFRVYGRVHGASGAVAGIFTYYNDTQESDIEIFTKYSPEYILYSNQPIDTGDPNYTPIAGAMTNLTTPSGLKYTDFLVHRFDWTRGQTIRSINGIQTNKMTVNVPQTPSDFYLDMWSANSSSSGSMKIGANASFDIQYVEMLFNVTNYQAPAGITAGKVCAVDFGAVSSPDGISSSSYSSTTSSASSLRTSSSSATTISMVTSVAVVTTTVTRYVCPVPKPKRTICA